MTAQRRGGNPTARVGVLGLFSHWGIFFFLSQKDQRLIPGSSSAALNLAVLWTIRPWIPQGPLWVTWRKILRGSWRGTSCSDSPRPASSGLIDSLLVPLPLPEFVKRTSELAGNVPKSRVRAVLVRVELSLWWFAYFQAGWKKSTQKHPLCHTICPRLVWFFSWCWLRPCWTWLCAKLLACIVSVSLDKDF